MGGDDQRARSRSRFHGDERGRDIEPPGGLDEGGIWERLAAGERTRQLLQAAASRPSDAYLFLGPDRSKSEAAKVLAAAILCPAACGLCDTCRRVLAGLHPDVQIYEPEGYTFPVELIRQVVAAAAQTPMESARRVFILEEAHRITDRSQNALLKGLEEPGRSVTWILTADTVEPLLPTILSRCQIIEFPPIGDAAIAGLLESRYGMNRREAGRITRAAGGSLQKAARLAVDEQAVQARNLAYRAATETVPSARWALAVGEEVGRIAAETRARVEAGQKEELAGLDEAMGKTRGAAGGRKKLIDRHKRAVRRAETDVYLDFLSWLGSAYRDLAAAASGAPSQALLFAEREDLTRKAAPERPIGVWLEMAKVCAEAQLAIRENANPSLTVEATLLRALAKDFQAARSGS